MKPLASAVTGLALLSGPAASAAPPALGAITVEAGDLDRQASPVSVALPPELAGKPLELRGPGGAIAVDVDSAGQGRFVLPRLARGKKATYKIRERAAAGAPAVEARADADGVWLTLSGKQVLFYRARGVAPRDDVKPELVRGGYIHPVLTPAGRTVTDDYPVDHKHHHGIWNAWTSTEYEGRKPDFWNMGSKKGRKDHVALGDTFSGYVAAGFQAKLSSTDLGATPPKVVIDEIWKVTLFHTHPAAGQGARAKAAPYYLFDLETTEKLVGTSPLRLLQYLYGGLAVRGPSAWLGEKNARFLTSEGKDRLTGENTPARWYFMGGDVEGKPIGIAVLGHPTNFRAPAPVRIHPKEPYFSVAPPKAGPFAIEPGQTVVTRYRFVVTDGRPDKGLLDRLWNDYADPVKATADLQRGLVTASTGAGTSPIAFAALTKRYGEFLAVDRLSLEVARGEVFGFLGPNGAGKTTTIRMLMGILVPTSGQAQIESWDCQGDRVEVARRVGYLPDNPIFYDYLRGREILEFVGEMHGLPRAEAVARAGRLLTDLALADASDEFAVNYSTGMKKKLGLCCALIHDPPVLVLDEPTNGLDPRASREVQDRIRSSAADGKTVFLSTHLLDMAERLCHRVGIIDGGRLVAVGTVEELRAQQRSGSSLEEVFLKVTAHDEAS